MVRPNLPNQLTIARCVLAIVFVVFMSFTHWLNYALAYITFLLATITDYWDGKIARRTQTVTKFGQLIDPVADKVLMVSAFIMLMKLEELKIPGWCVVVILTRELLVTGLRAFAAVEGTVIPADPYGKVKTVLQMTYVFVFLFIATLRRFLLDIPTTLISAERIYSYDTIVSSASLIAIMLVAFYTLFSGLEILWKNKQILYTQ